MFESDSRNRNPFQGMKKINNPLAAMLMSGASGFGMAKEQPIQNYVQANWAGNGLAKTGLGQMVNPRYRDYASGGMALAQRYNMGELGQGTGIDIRDRLRNILGKLSGMKTNLGNWTYNHFGRNRVGDFSYGNGSLIGNDIA